jgi:hypothetical protein
MIKRIIDRFLSEIDKLMLMVEKSQKSGWIAHHGIQRSGTNFLLMCLKRYGLNVINRHDPERNNPAHKHFRWYHDKSIIPSEIHYQYYNSTIVNNVRDLNRTCNFPFDTRHIIIFKERHASLVSILNWGLRVNWFDTKLEAISVANKYLNDIDAYNKFWAELSVMSPKYVQLVRYEDVMNDNTILSDALFRLGFMVNPIDLSIAEVPHSPRYRKAKITYDDIVHLL